MVLVKAQKINKLSSNFNPSPFLVVKKEGGEVTLRSDEGVEMKRNASFLWKYNIEDDGISAELNGGVADHAADIPTELHGDVTDDTADASGVETTHGHNSPKRQSPAPSRPQRAMKMPVRFKDFVLSK